MLLGHGYVCKCEQMVEIYLKESVHICVLRTLRTKRYGFPNNLSSTNNKYKYIEDHIDAEIVNTRT
jgi:hypothetical protein